VIRILICMRDYDVRPPFDTPPPKEKPKKIRRKRNWGSTISNLLTKGIALTVLVLLILVMVLPSWKPYRESLMEYLTAGLEYYQEDPEFSEFMVERILTLKSSGGELDYTLTMTVPKNSKINDYEIQKVIKFESSNSHIQGKLEQTSDLVYWKGTISGEQTVSISVTYHLRGYTADWNINTKNTGTVDDYLGRNWTRESKDVLITNGMKDNYTMDRWEVYDDSAKTRPLPYRDIDGDGIVPDYRIAPNNPTLNSLAHHLVGNEKNVYMMAFKIYDFIDNGGVFNNITYGWEGGGFAYPTQDQMADDQARYFGKPKPANVTLNDGYGDCDDQAILFISLARAVGIPAWLEAGALYNEFGANPDDRWEGHGWAKMLVPMKDGKLEEPCVDPVNNLFLKRDANRYSDWEDPGGERSEYQFSIKDIRDKSYLKDDDDVNLALKTLFTNNGIKGLPNDAKIKKIDSYHWKITDIDGKELYNIQDFTTELKIFKKKPDIPQSPLDIENYYTSWTYLIKDQSPRPTFSEDHITHFFNQYKSNLEIKV